MGGLWADLYELNMAASYLRRGMDGFATFMPTFIGRRPAAGLPVHDAHGANANGVDRALKQALDLRRRHVHALASELEDLAHPDAAVVVGSVGVR